MMRRISLNKRMALISLSVLLPMFCLTWYLVQVLDETNRAFGDITESITYANTYSLEFRERMDYSMYLAVIRGEHLDQLEQGVVTVNGVKVVNPYEYSRELDRAFDRMRKIATVESNKNLVDRMKKTLRSLNKKITQIDENMGKSVNYDENLSLLRGDVYNLTEIIENGIQSYIYAENNNFSKVREETIAQSANAFQLALIIVLVVTIMAVCMTLLASHSVTQPIQQLCTKVRQLAKGDFSSRTEETMAGDEIAVLYDSFNDMAREIGNLVEDIKTEQNNLRMTETKLLQAQINPHFLYNTLDTIVWLAEEKQTEDVVSMVTWLSDFFRTTLSKGKDYITVQEERSHIESYLKIQQFRYQDILEYEIDIDESIGSYLVPKLTLQPVVENALYHGIKMKRGKGKIMIRGFQKGESLIFQVTDNGKGMDSQTLEKLRRRIEGNSLDKNGGYGLANVNQRIQYYYGNGYGVFMDSRENIGTEVTITIAAKKNIHLS